MRTAMHTTKKGAVVMNGAFFKMVSLGRPPWEDSIWGKIRTMSKDLLADTVASTKAVIQEQGWSVPGEMLNPENSVQEAPGKQRINNTERGERHLLCLSKELWFRFHSTYTGQPQERFLAKEIGMLWSDLIKDPAGWGGGWATEGQSEGGANN